VNSNCVLCAVKVKKPNQKKKKKTYKALQVHLSLPLTMGGLLKASKTAVMGSAT